MQRLAQGQGLEGWQQGQPLVGAGRRQVVLAQALALQRMAHSRQL